MKKLILLLTILSALTLGGCSVAENTVNQAKDKSVEVLMNSLKETANKDTLDTMLKQAKEKYGDKFNYNVEIVNGKANITVDYDGNKYTTKTDIDGGLTK